MHVRLPSLALGLLLLLVCAVPAVAAPVTVNLRVEGKAATHYEGPVTVDVRTVDGNDGSGAHTCDTTLSGGVSSPHRGRRPRDRIRGHPLRLEGDVVRELQRLLRGHDRRGDARLRGRLDVLGLLAQRHVRQRGRVQHDGAERRSDPARDRDRHARARSQLSGPASANQGTPVVVTVTDAGTGAPRGRHGGRRDHGRRWRGQRDVPVDRRAEPEGHGSERDPLQRAERLRARRRRRHLRHHQARRGHRTARADDRHAAGRHARPHRPKGAPGQGRQRREVRGRQGPARAGRHGRRGPVGHRRGEAAAHPAQRRALLVLQRPQGGVPPHEVRAGVLLQDRRPTRSGATCCPSASPAGATSSTRWRSTARAIATRWSGDAAASSSPSR